MEEIGEGMSERRLRMRRGGRASREEKGEGVKERMTKQGGKKGKKEESLLVMG
jgi:hypothetical protein